MTLDRILGWAGAATASVVGTAAGVVSGVTELVTASFSTTATRATFHRDSPATPVGAGESGATRDGVDRSGSGRVHVPLRGVHHPDAQPAAQRVETWLRSQDGVQRAEVNAVLGHVMVEYDPGRLTVRDITALVARAEEDCGLAGEPRLPPPHTHPAAAGPVLLEAVFAALHLAGLGYTAVGRAVRLPGLVSLAVSALSLVDAAPRGHALLRATLGERGAAALVTTATALSNAAGRRPTGLLVDAVHRVSTHRELAARRAAWARWEAELAQQEGGHRAWSQPDPTRPRPLPHGPVERVSDRVAAAGLAGAVGLLVARRSSQAAAAALIAGAAKAATSGREGFATRLGIETARRDGLVLDPAALRRLDRVDIVVLDAALLRTGRYAVDEVVPVTDRLGVSELTERAHDLVDPRHPRRRRAGGGWSVAPVPGDPAETAVSRVPAGETVLAMRRGEETVALVGVNERLDPFVEPLLAAARAVGAVLVHGDAQVARRLWGVATAPAGVSLRDTVRDLQRRGHVVAVVAADSAALSAADIGIGVARPGEPPPWGAHVFVHRLEQACLLLDAAVSARRVSARSAQLAVVGSVAGGVLAVLGPGGDAAGRAAFAVHMTSLVALGSGLWQATATARRPAPVSADTTPWHAMSPAAVLDTLRTTRAGLPEDESRRRRRPPPRDDTTVGVVRASAEELANPLTPVLATGAGLSAATGSALDALLITTVVVVNALIGGVQRVTANRALRTLRSTSVQPVRVRRAGVETRLPADAIVPGDVITLHAGDAVPADCRIVSASGLEVDESALTGESTPVAKSAQAVSTDTLAERSCMLYEGTVVAAGRAEAVVVATGEHTEAGRTLRHDDTQAPPTGVELRLRDLTGRVLPLCIGAGIGLAVIDLLRRRPLPVVLGRAVSLAVAAVPEGLPFVATVAELAAARRLSARGALVRNPSTIEALGRVEVLCFDKTGTLTEGRIRLRGVSTGRRTVTVDDSLSPEMREVVAAAVRASPFHLAPDQVTHQTDRAILRGARAVGITAADLGAEHLDELPFESNRGYHATLWRDDSGTHVSVKGAPEVVLPLCAARSVDRRVVEREVDRLARRGHRVLAVAERVVPGRSRADEADVRELTFRGLVAMVDPVRPTAAEAVATLRAAGVEVVMVTGDHPSTAEAIGAELDLIDGRGVLTGAEVDALTDDELAAAIPRTSVFARMTPSHKARVVRLLQRSGAAVAVTGDGTNDVPAIRSADVGIALGRRATPAAREAADVVVTDDRIETITDAIVEGRAMWVSVRDALSILLGGNLGEVVYAIITSVLSGTAALNARQLLLVNLLTDVLPAMAVAVRPPAGLSAADLLAEGPESSLGGALTRDIRVRAVTTAAAAGAAWLAARPVSTPGQASTTGLVALVGAQLGQTLVVRGRTPLVAAGVAGSLVLLVAAVQVPVLSRVAGCRPLLPHQWAIGLTAASLATAAQWLLQRRFAVARG